MLEVTRNSGVVGSHVKKLQCEGWVMVGLAISYSLYQAVSSYACQYACTGYFSPHNFLTLSILELSHRAPILPCEKCGRCLPSETFSLILSATSFESHLLRKDLWIWFFRCHTGTDRKEEGHWCLSVENRPIIDGRSGVGPRHFCSSWGCYFRCENHSLLLPPGSLFLFSFHSTEWLTPTVSFPLY